MSPRSPPPPGPSRTGPKQRAVEIEPRVDRGTVKNKPEIKFLAKKHNTVKPARLNLIKTPAGTFRLMQLSIVHGEAHKKGMQHHKHGLESTLLMCLLEKNIKMFYLHMWRY